MKIFNSMQRLFFISLFISTLAATISAQSRSGKYYDGYTGGNVTFREVTRGKTKLLSFEFSVAGAELGSCSGSLDGEAKWIDTNVAEYKINLEEADPENGEADSCRLTFTFSGNRVVVIEQGCNTFHGASCSFEGTFKRPHNTTKSKKKSKRRHS